MEGRELRTALRTAETSSYTYFGVLRRSLLLSKLRAEDHSLR
jgi:hypothetical protein